MIQTYTIPDNADRATLTELHNEILAVNPSIRVVNRWGSFTEYDVKLKKRDAAKLLEDETPEDVWRLVFGADHTEAAEAFTVDVQFYDAEKRYWESTCLDVGDPGALIERATAWLREHHPAAEALVEIDGRLLSDGLELREWIAHVRQLTADAGRSQRSLADELGISQQLVQRALDPEQERPTPDVTARIAALLGEAWVERRVWSRE
jgi:hypothetical protein